MLAALLFLTAPYAAAEIINLDKGSPGLIMGMSRRFFQIEDRREAGIRVFQNGAPFGSGFRFENTLQIALHDGIKSEITLQIALQIELHLVLNQKTHYIWS